MEEINIMEEKDVIVVGGGVSGCAAALAAGRLGVSVCLLERSGMLGGVATSAPMNSMTNLFFTKKDKQVIYGIPNEIVTSGVEEGIISPHWKTHEYRQIPFDSDKLQIILFNKLKKAGVDIYTHCWALDSIIENKTINGVIVQTRAGKKLFQSKVVIDATGDLDIVASSSEEYNYDNGSASLLFELCNVDLDTTFNYFVNNPEEYTEKISCRVSFEAFKRNYLKRDLFHIQHGGGRYISLLQEEIKKGNYSREKGLGVRLDALGLFGNKGTGKILVNSNFYYLNELSNLNIFSQAEFEARERCIELYELLKKVMPGFEKAQIARIGTELGSRRTRWLKGKYLLEDVSYKQEYDDAIGMIPTILVEKELELEPEVNKGCHFFGSETVQLPLGVLLPKNINNLLVGTGKGASIDWKARLWTRLMPCCMLLGQAAGTVAGTAVKTQKSTMEINFAKVKKNLVDSNVYL